MRRTFLVLLMTILPNIVRAVPARPTPFYVVQPDGTTLCLRIVGDERYHYYLTNDDDIPVVQQQNGESMYYVYAEIKNNTIQASDFLAHNKTNRSCAEDAYITSNIETNLIETKEYWNKKKFACDTRTKNTTRLNKDGFVNKIVGAKKGLVLLVDFVDCTMSFENPNFTFMRLFNEVGFNEYNHIGSVHDYFYDQSYGQLDLTFDVVGPITVSKKLSYYGANDLATGRNDVRIGQLVTEACYLADSQINFADYDWNGDGEVDQVFIIYAGYGEASGGASFTIWPHEFSLTGCKYWGDSDGPIYLDGVKIDTYACSCELAGNQGAVLNGIGTACHEFSHCLGLPDLYDTDYSGAFGMDKWDLMDSGAYSGPNGNGEIPYGYSAFEKACVGWLEMVELNENCNKQLPPLNDIPIAYKISNNSNPSEFFVIENHKDTGWYSFLGTAKGMHGMMITHIDYNETCWAMNNVNSYPTHMRCSIVPADGNYGVYNAKEKRYYTTEEDLSGDLFPGIKHITRMTGLSHSTSGGLFFNVDQQGSNIMNLNIENISEKGNLISFSVGHKILPPNNINAYHYGDTLDISWDVVDDADSYSLIVTKIISIVPSKIETIEINDIEESRFSLQNIQCQSCNVRLKSKNAYVSSEWSDLIRATNAPSAIHSIENDNVLLSKFYDINGREVFELQKGVNIIKKGNNTKKVFVK